MKRRVTLAAAVLLCGTLAGCAGPLTDACPAIGWMNTLTVEVTGDAARVAHVDLCVADGCASDPERPAELGVVRGTPTGGDTWRFELSGGPEAFSVRVYDATDAVLADAPVQPEWVRVGGTERCGGPHEATLTIEV